MLVVEVQRRRHPLSKYSRPEPARSPLRDAPLEDQLHLIGPAQVEVLANHLLEEDTATQRPVQDLGQRELGLEDRYVVAIAGQTIRRGKRMGQKPQPLPQQRIDLVIRQVVAELLQSSGVGATQD